MKGKRILIADDEAHVLHVLRFAFEKQGYVIETVHNGAEALVQVFKNPPDLLITDMMMPRMTGQELCQSIHKSGLERHFPIWVITSRVEYTDRDWVHLYHNVELFEKPISPRMMIKRMNEYFELEGAANDA